ncbi:hypothetical protein BH23PSE2_BH23PSE2_12360 [soil metagenome]
MRQVFSSPRLENVEAVAALLRAQDIEIRVSNGRSYRSGIRGNFSYRDSTRTGPVPAVWVLRADQQPLARQVLREAGLLQTGRNPDDSFLPPNLQFGAGNLSGAEKRQRSKLRYLLLAAIAAATALVLITTRPRAPDPMPATPVPAAAQAGSPLVATETIHPLPTPPALAAMLFARTLEAQTGASACLAIDGADPSAELLQGLARDGQRVRGASECADEDALLVEVRDYRTDGSGVGTVELVLRDNARRLQVGRRDADWLVLEQTP